MTNTCIIASYKYGHLAAQAIESVLHQTKKFDRIIFIDDGVGDCKHLPAIYPEVEYILRPKNLGVVANFNDALSRVKTEKVMFLGADNWLDHRTLEITAARDEDIVAYDGWLVQDGEYKRWSVGVPHGSSLYRVAKARAAGGYEASGKKHPEEDSILFSRMRQNGCTFVSLPYQLLYYRWRHRTNFNK